MRCTTFYTGCRSRRPHNCLRAGWAPRDDLWVRRSQHDHAPGADASHAAQQFVVAVAQMAVSIDNYRRFKAFLADLCDVVSGRESELALSAYRTGAE